MMCKIISIALLILLSAIGLLVGWNLYNQRTNIYELWAGYYKTRQMIIDGVRTQSVNDSNKYYFMRLMDRGEIIEVTEGSSSENDRIIKLMRDGEFRELRYGFAIDGYQWPVGPGGKFWGYFDVRVQKY